MDFKKLLNILNPQPKIGALEISDVDLKFGQIENDKFIFHSVKLAADVIKNGRIKNREGFLSALSVIHSQITAQKKKKISTIVNLPDNNVYFQVFNLPALESNLEEAVNLNLKMISPIDFEKSYSDWQMLGEEIIDGLTQLEIFGVFGESRMIDEFDESLRLAGFMPVAFEFNGLALARLAVDFGTNVDKKKPFLLLYVGPNGLSFNTIRNGNIYFNHFVSWQTINSETREVSLEIFNKTITEEIKKVLSFYGTRHKEQIEEILLVSHGLNDSLIKIMSENFSFFKKIEPLNLGKIGGIDIVVIQPAWFPVLGSAIRGTISRSKDTIVSLAKTGTEEEFFRHRTIGFIKFWRNVVLSSLVIMAVVFAGIGYLFMDKTIVSLNSQLANISGYGKSQKEEFEKNSKEIEGLNQKIDFAVKVSAERSKWSEFFEKINNLATAGNISIKRIYVQSIDAPVLINAIALNEDAAVGFKNKLIENDFKDVNFPITKISRTGRGVEFTVTFKIK